MPLCTVTGDDGFETCVISFERIVAAEGALVGVPEVTLSQSSTLLAVADEELNDAEVLLKVYDGSVLRINRTVAANLLLSFTLSSAGSGEGDVGVLVEYETPKGHEPLRFEAVKAADRLIRTFNR